MPLTTAAAAKLLGLSERQLQHLAANGQIPGARKFGSAWQFPRKPQVIRPKRGRPALDSTT
jgi:excisionase family DNA binding protein